MARVEELNARLYSRNVPSSAPPMVFSPRPVQTKYCKQPILDVHVAPSVPIRNSGPVAFLPGDGAPFSGFDVDVDSTLRNIDFALQRHPMAVYVPQSASDLYNSAAPRPQPVQQPHPMLFASVVAAPRAGPPASPLVFNNVRLREPISRL
jgi:hypothetical protein